MSNPPAVKQHPSDFIAEVARQRAELLRKEASDPRRRLLVVGIPGCGKTYSVCTTFPGVHVLDYDNQLNDPAVQAKLVGYYPMWDVAWVKDSLKLIGSPIDRLVGVLNVLAQRLDAQSTVVLDSMSTLGDLFKEFLEQCPEAKKDSYWLWKQWAMGWRTVCTKLKDLPCNVALLAHETEVRDDASGRLEKYGWLLQGKEFTPRIPAFFTDVVRMTHTVVPSKDGSIERETWMWQIKPTVDFPYAKSRCKANTLAIPAKWSELIK